MPVLKGPDTRNLENLFSPRYSNQAVHKAPTLVTSFCQQASMLHLFPPGLEQGPWCPSHHLINWKSLSRWLPRLTRHTVSTPDRTSWSFSGGMEGTPYNNFPFGGRCHHQWHHYLCVLVGSQNPAFSWSQWKETIGQLSVTSLRASQSEDLFLRGSNLCCGVTPTQFWSGLHSSSLSLHAAAELCTMKERPSNSLCWAEPCPAEAVTELVFIYLCITCLVFHKTKGICQISKMQQATRKNSNTQITSGKLQILYPFTSISLQ